MSLGRIRSRRLKRRPATTPPHPVLPPPQPAMPVPTMAEPAPDHQKRFQAAVDVIQSLPKDGSYRPSYEVMLRFYGLYKQAMCGPCTMSRPGFWDPVGRYKWSVDAWSRLGEMSSESAMAAYVDEMKKVAQEVIDTMPMNEKTASLFHHFEPLYVVIDDMPCPPPSLLHLQEGVKYAEQLDEQTEEKPAEDDVIEVDQVPKEEAPTLITIPTYTPTPTLPGEGMLELSLTTSTILHDCGVSEGVVLTSDSESEVFCDSVDSVEQLHCVKASRPPTKVEAVKSNGFQNGHSHAEPPPLHSHPQHPHPHPHAAVPGVMQVGAGQGGEGAGDGKDPPMRRGRHGGREGGGDQSRRERGAPQGGPRQPGRGGGGGGGSVSGDRGGRGGGGGWEGGGPEPSQDAQLQQQIVLALRRLRDDMRSVMERLEEVERLAAVHAENPNWRPCVLCAASQQKEEKWWPFDVSGQTLLLLLLWPFAAHGLMLVLRKARRRHRISS